MGMKRIFGAVAVAALLAPATAQAQLLEIGVGAQMWHYSPSGDFQYGDDEWSIDDSEDGFGLDSSRDGVFWADFRHPVPMIPSVKVTHTRVQTDGEGTLTAEREFGDVTFSENADVASDLTLDQTDFTLYFTPPTPVVTLDLGLNVKYLDGEAEVEEQNGNGERERVSFSGPIPMGYARAAVDLPLTGLRLEGAGSAISYDGHRLTDVRAGLRYDAAFGLGVEGGYRHMRLKLDDLDDVDVDMTLDGPYVGVSFIF